jgi:hypothetical protein
MQSITAGKGLVIMTKSIIRDRTNRRAAAS